MKINKFYNNYVYQCVSRIRNSLPDSEKKTSVIYIIFVMFILNIPILLAYVFEYIFNNFLGTFIGFLLGILFLVLYMNLYKVVIVKKFCKIKNAYLNFNVINVNDTEKIKYLCSKSALTFNVPLNDINLNFIYNWLSYENVLKDKNLNIYVFNGKLLKKAFQFCSYPDDFEFKCIDLDDLNLSSKNMKFYDNHFYVGSRWLDDIVDNERKK